MSTSPADDRVADLVTFTAQGDRALDRLAAELVNQSDGSLASIANILDRVLSADIEDLAERLRETPEADTGPAPETPDQVACRRLGEQSPIDDGTIESPRIGPSR